MTAFVFYNPDGIQNKLVEHLFAESRRPEERYFAESYGEARSVMERLEGGEVIAVVSSELKSERGCICSSDLISELRERGYGTIIYTSRKLSDLSPELKNLVDSGVKYIKREIDHLHGLDHFSDFLDYLKYRE